MSVENHHRIHENVQDKDKFALIHNKKSVKIIDEWVMVVGVLSPLTSIPQIFQIVTTQDSQGVSIATWILYIFLGMFWLVYGIAHEEKPIIVNNTLWIIFEVVIVSLILVYR